MQDCLRLSYSPAVQCWPDTCARPNDIRPSLTAEPAPASGRGGAARGRGRGFGATSEGREERNNRQNWDDRPSRNWDDRPSRDWEDRPSRNWDDRPR